MRSPRPAAGRACAGARGRPGTPGSTSAPVPCIAIPHRAGGAELRHNRRACAGHSIEAFAVFAGLRQRKRVAVIHFMPRPWGRSSSVSISGAGGVFSATWRWYRAVKLPRSLSICNLLNYLPGAVVIRVHSVRSQISHRGCALGLDLLKPSRRKILIKVSHGFSP